MPAGIETVYGIAFLGAMVAIAVGLTWVGLNEDFSGPPTDESEPAD